MGLCTGMSETLVPADQHFLAHFVGLAHFVQTLIRIAAGRHAVRAAVDEL